VTGAERIRVGPARVDEVDDVVAAITALLRELRGDDSYEPAGMREAVTAFVTGQVPGGVLVARDPAGVRGVLAYSIPVAIRVAGAYCLIQELWVDPQLRSRGVAGELLAGLAEVCRREKLTRVEVCLPSPRFAAFDRTVAFYERSGFRMAGPRAMWDLP